MRTVFIYTLADPRTGAIRYVGKTRNPSQRRHNHLNSCRDKNTHKRNWINQVRKFGLLPVMEILDEVPENQWHFWERYWILQIKAWGFTLLNYGQGGEGLTFGNQTSFKNGLIPWNKGMPATSTTKNKISSSLKGNIPYNRKAVVQYNLQGVEVAEYLSCHHAAKALNTYPIRIADVCNGKRKTHKKYLFKYKTNTI